jgi:hypothetical protein
MGRLNDISQMCPFMKLFKSEINKCVATIASDAPAATVVTVSQQAKNDLQIWAGYLNSDFKWLPICRELWTPPIWHKEFVSDAAGLTENAGTDTRPGCGNVGFREDGTIIFANQLTWPEKFIRDAKDEKHVRFGDKTTTLEMIGVLIPLLLVPEEFKNAHVTIKVDCLGTIYGMENRFSKGDQCASIFIRAAYLIAAYLECTLHVVHLPRMSDWGAEVTDRLSRRSTTTKQDKKLLEAFSNRKVPECLADWFRNPTSDMSLAVSLLEYVKSLV